MPALHASAKPIFSEGPGQNGMFPGVEHQIGSKSMKVLMGPSTKMPKLFHNFKFPKRHKCTCGRVSVKAYGAKGDYDPVANTGHDDTAAIRKAIKAVAASGETLCFPPGKYKITGALALPSDFRLTGASAANCKLITPTCSSFPVFDINGRARIHLSDISVEYGESPTASTAGLYVHDGACEILIERCIFKGGNIPILIGGTIVQ